MHHQIDSKLKICSHTVENYLENASCILPVEHSLKLSFQNPNPKIIKNEHKSLKTAKKSILTSFWVHPAFKSWSL